MPARLKPPPHDTLLATDTDGTLLYAWLQPGNPFFPKVRVILPKGYSPRSYWLAWHVDAQRFVRSHHASKLPAEAALWVAGELSREYPSVAEIVGCTVAEADEMRAEMIAARDAKRAEKVAAKKKT